MGILTVALAAVSMAAGQADERVIRLRAELRPGSLTPGCDFSVTVAESGVLTVITTDDQGLRRQVDRALTTNEVNALSKRIADIRFFSLPKSVGCFMPEATDRWMRVGLGRREHTVTLGVWPAACGDVGFLAEAGEQEADRALKLWTLIQGWAAPSVPRQCR